MLAKIATVCDPKYFKWFYVSYIAMLAICAFFSVGWLQADEHARVVEAASYVAHQPATLPWELQTDKPIVSMLLGVIHAPIIMLTDSLPISGLTQAAILRLWSMLICSTGIIAFFRLLAMIRLPPERRGLYLFLYAFSLYTPVLLLRTSQENWSSAAHLWSLCLLLSIATNRHAVDKLLSWQLSRSKPEQLTPTGPDHIRLMLFGTTLALVFSFRLQMGFAAAGLGFLSLRIFGYRQLVWVVIGLLLGLLPMAIVDYFFVGIPFSPAWNYLHYALSNEEGGHVWGTGSALDYIGAFFGLWYPPLSLLLVVPFLIGIFSTPLLFVSFIPFTIVHFILGHKEIRYFSPMIPLIMLACFIGCVRVETLLRTSTRLWCSSLLNSGSRLFLRAMPAYAIFAAIFSVLICFVALNPSARLYNELRVRLEDKRLHTPFVYVANSLSNISLFYFKHPDVMPLKIEIEQFMNDLRKGRLPLQQYAFYRLDVSLLREVENHCVLEYLSVSPLVRNAMETLSPILRKKDVDGIVRCPR